jgi:hypothetical protein
VEIIFHSENILRDAGEAVEGINVMQVVHSQNQEYKSSKHHPRYSRYPVVVNELRVETKTVCSRAIAFEPKSSFTAFFAHFFIEIANWYKDK